eukprot:3429017-Amphidinium_carterae.2
MRRLLKASAGQPCALGLSQPATWRTRRSNVVEPVRLMHLASMAALPCNILTKLAPPRRSLDRNPLLDAIPFDRKGAFFFTCGAT